MKLDSKIFIAGHHGLVGSALVRQLQSRGYHNLILRSRSELDLTNKNAVDAFYAETTPDIVIVAAAKVGGIQANNTYRADFIYENLSIQNNVIWGAHTHNVSKLVFLGSSCIYPKFAPQPIHESHLLTGELEYTNQPYALAKIAGLELVDSLHKQYGRNYFSVMPTNLYGPGDNYNLQNSHVLPATIYKFTQAVRENQAQVPIWGTGTAKREFMHADDCASAIVFLLEKHDRKDFSYSHINIGTGQELTIKELVSLVVELTDYRGRVLWDHSKPDGSPRKLLDCSYLHTLGWNPQIPLKKGIQDTINIVKESIEHQTLKI